MTTQEIEDLERKIASLERQLAQHYYEIGKLFLDLIAQESQKADQLVDTIIQERQKLNQAKGQRICSHCATHNSCDHRYCKYCGHRLT